MRIAYYFVLAASLTLFGCAELPEVQIVSYPGFAFDDQWTDCADIQILEPGVAAPGGCQQFGDVFIGDTGTTSPCEPKDLMRHLRAHACRKRATTVEIIRLDEPSGSSRCYQVRAALLHCGSEGEK